LGAPAFSLVYTMAFPHRAEQNVLRDIGGKAPAQLKIAKNRGFIRTFREQTFYWFGPSRDGVEKAMREEKRTFESF
jgi:hypothetical protein